MENTLRSHRIAIAQLGSLVGLALWVVLLIALPAPLASRMFLAAPLLIVPLLLARMPRRQLIAGRDTAHLGAAACLPAAALLAISFALPAGPLAALVALPWIALTSVSGLAALRHGVPRLPALFGRGMTADLAADGAMGFVAIGGLFVAVDRLGVAVLGSGPPYTMLGAIHYHFAGFGLLGLIAVQLVTWGPTGLPTSHWLAALAVIGGVSVTAVGLIVDSTLVNWLGVLLLAAGGLIVAWSFVSSDSPGWRRASLVLAGAALTGGLLMGMAWASAMLFGAPFIGMDQMVRSHGAVNAGAVVLATLALALPSAGEART